MVLTLLVSTGSNSPLSCVCQPGLKGLKGHQSNCCEIFRQKCPGRMAEARTFQSRQNLCWAPISTFLTQPFGSEEIEQKWAQESSEGMMILGLCQILGLCC